MSELYRVGVVNIASPALKFRPYTDITLRHVPRIGEYLEFGEEATGGFEGTQYEVTKVTWIVPGTGNEAEPSIDVEVQVR